MAEIKWIRMTTNMFEDEKIDFIESLPEADAILIIWIRLLTMAGKCNANGYIFLTEKISYTEEMLAHKFKKPLNTVKLAMQTLKTLEMIEFVDNCLKIVNWEKHQNIEGMDKIREQNRLRNQKYREQKKQILLPDVKSDVTRDVTEMPNDETELDIDIDIDIDKDTTTIEKVAEAPHEEIINLFNTICISFNPVKQLTNKRKGLINARFRENSKSVEIFKNVFEKMQNSNFLKGGWNTGGKANFDWVMLPTNFVNVLEDKYINNANNTTKQQQTKPTNKFHNFNQKMAGMGETALEEVMRKKLEKLGGKNEKLH